MSDIFKLRQPFSYREKEVSGIKKVISMSEHRAQQLISLLTRRELTDENRECSEDAVNSSRISGAGDLWTDGVSKTFVKNKRA